MAWPATGNARWILCQSGDGMSALPNTIVQHPVRAPLAESCFHCGLPVPIGSKWKVNIAAIERSMCCPGCQAVAQTIVDNGCEDYYSNRSALAASVGDADLLPPELRLYDSDEGRKRFAPSLTPDADIAETTLSIDGIRCAACVWLIEKRLMQVPGIVSADMNVATERLHVRWRIAECQPSAILEAMHSIGYAAFPYDPDQHAEKLRRVMKQSTRRLFVAGLSMMQVMMYAVPAYMATDGTLDDDMAALMRWASLVLTLPAVLYSAQPFFKGAWHNLRQGSLGMDVPIALGIAAAFLGSCWAMLAGHGDVYFDSVTMFIFLLLCSRSLELNARRKAASALERLQHGLPASATRVVKLDGLSRTEIVAAAALEVGDCIMVKPGETFAADGVIVEGRTSIDLSLLSGESVALARAEGESVAGGAVNVSQPVMVQVVKPMRDSTLSLLLKLVERAGAGKPTIALWADRVAAWFVLVLLVFAVAVFGVWSYIDLARALPIAIAVLVVSCPCALSLATPTAIAAATDNLLAQGVLVIQAHVLETLYRASVIVFDKTGTLTNGRPSLERVHTWGSLNEDDALAMAAALDAQSSHPLAKAICDAAASRMRSSMQPIYVPQSVDHQAGHGIAANIDGRTVRLGSMMFVAELVGHPAPIFDEAAASHVYLGQEGQWLARFDLCDQLRSDAAVVVSHFRRTGKRVILLSGDAQQMVDAVGRQLQIDEAYGQQLPQQKYEFIKALQARGERVCMIGDGLNDAAVLRAADVSFAMASGASLAQLQADAVLFSGKLGAVVIADRLASKTMRVIQQNLTWASLYNLIAIPAAALGLLNPWMSGIGMSLSSALVVLNALRLRPVVNYKRVEVPASGSPIVPVTQ